MVSSKNITNLNLVKNNKKKSSKVSALSPREIVSELDRYVIGQKEAKKAVAVALRNRWRRQALSDAMRDEVLPKNKTYVFNFGQSIVDNNEGNVLPYFKYIFSTGNFIDSLKVTGNVKNVINRNTEEYISTFLYPVDEDYSDSIIYNSLPRYVGSTLDTTSYEISNIKAGKYLMIALKDLNKIYCLTQSLKKLDF